MLLRNSISNTKKFFQKTLQSFKSFFSAAEPYQKLSKTSPYNPYSFTTAGVDVNPQTNYQDLEKFYTDFTDRWYSDNGKAKKRSKKKIIMSTSTREQKEGNKGSFTQFTIQRREDINQSKTRSTAKVEKRQENYSYSKSKREAEVC